MTWSDIQSKNTNKNYARRYLQILVRWYKNQEFRYEPNWLFISTPTCTKTDCKCHILNFYEMFFILQQRRPQNYTQLKNQQHRFMSVQQKRLNTKRLNNLGTAPNDFIFVGKWFDMDTIKIN